MRYFKPRYRRGSRRFQRRFKRYNRKSYNRKGSDYKRHSGLYQFRPIRARKEKQQPYRYQTSRGHIPYFIKRPALRYGFKTGFNWLANNAVAAATGFNPQTDWLRDKGEVPAIAGDILSYATDSLPSVSQAASAVGDVALAGARFLDPLQYLG